MRLRNSALLHGLWLTLASALVLPGEAMAAWGNENWGTMVWGQGASPPVLPALGIVGLTLLGMILAGAAAWTLRKRRRALGATLVLVVVAFSASPGWSATIVYDNTTPISNSTDCTGELECGDEITLALGPRTVSAFEFAYIGDFSQDGDEAVRIRFYANDGSGGTPGTVLFDSGDVAASPSLVPQFVTLTGLSVVVPDTFTWSLQASGLDFANSERVTIPFAGPPTVGSSDPSFIWFNQPAGWIKFGRNKDHYARVNAIPEPGTGLLLMTGLLGLAVRRRV